ncbi:MAG: STAS domain-containing protein [Planctomycetota bacterium]|nr:STAS domain-containing protein [Planctomycetota bacterium]
MSSGSSLPDHLTVLRFDAPVEGSPFAVRLVKEHDKEAFTALLEEMRSATERVYIMDLTGKSFCGTMRLGLLLRMQQALRASGRVMRIAADQRELLEVFRLTRLNTIMPLYTNLTDALAEAVRPI